MVKVLAIKRLQQTPPYERSERKVFVSLYKAMVLTPHHTAAALAKIPLK